MKGSVRFLFDPQGPEGMIFPLSTRKEIYDSSGVGAVKVLPVLETPFLAKNR